MLTQDQVKANIDAMQKQGASNGDIQGYLDTLKSQTQSAPTDAFSQGNAQNVLGDIAGGAKALGSALVSAPSVFGSHLAELTGSATDAIGLTTGKRAAIDAKIAANGNKTPLGNDMTPLKKDFVGAASQLGGDALSTGTEAFVPGEMGIAKMAGLGAASAYGGSLSQGNSFDSQESIDSAKQGGLFGGALGILGKIPGAISTTEKFAGGFTPAMQKELQKGGENLVSDYIKIAKNSAKDYDNPTVDQAVNADVMKGVHILQHQVEPKIGEMMDNAQKLSGGFPIAVPQANGVAATGANALPLLKDDINNVMQKMTGHQLAEYATGEDSGLDIFNYKGASTAGITGPDGSLVSRLPDSSIDLDAADQKKLDYVAQQLNILGDNPTVKTASDILKNLDKKINWDKPILSSKDPVDGFIRYARGAINKTIAPAAPELAAAKTAWGKLQDIKGNLADAAGKDLDHLGLLARRTLYQGQDDKATTVLEGLYNAVKPYLPAGEPSYATKARIASFARNAFGGERAVTGLGSSLSTGDVAGFAGYRKQFLQSAFKAGKQVLAPNPEQYALSLARGKPYSFVPGIHNLEKLGLPSDEIGNTLMKLGKTSLFEGATKPKKTLSQ